MLFTNNEIETVNLIEEEYITPLDLEEDFDLLYTFGQLYAQDISEGFDKAPRVYVEKKQLGFFPALWLVLNSPISTIWERGAA